MIFPFPAMVGQERAKLALLIAAVEPGVQGVLLAGDKGTGKTTMVRALADILPEVEVIEPCPFNCSASDDYEVCRPCIEALSRGEARVVRRKMTVVDLPLSITVDRLIGTIDIKRALREGVRALEPGLSAKAHRNILYIDEVNLLDDYIADLLLDAATSGWVVVEREGISLRYPSRFILVGSMNPEEGELRPQFLDRFGLYVKIEAEQDAEARAEIVRRVEEFRRDPEEFRRRYEPLQTELKAKILRAMELLPKVEISDDVLNFIAKTVVELGIKTHRAEIITARAAKAIAALEGRTSVTIDDVKKAMELTLPHRLKRRPFEPPPSGGEWKGGNPPSKPPGGGNRGQRAEGGPREGGNRGQRAEGGPREASQAGEEAKTPPHARPNLPELDWRNLLRSFIEGGSGRGSRGVSGLRSQRGQPVDYAIPKGDADDVNIFATINAMAVRGGTSVEAEDLRVNRRRGREVRLISLLVDASRSMYADMKIATALGAAAKITEAAYVNRDFVSLVVFQGREAALMLPTTKKYSELLSAIRSIKIGGKTPLSSALYLLLEEAKRFKNKYKGVVKAILITDGRANIPLGLAETIDRELALLTLELKRLGVELATVDVRPNAYTPSYTGTLAAAGWQIICLSC